MFELLCFSVKLGSGDLLIKFGNRSVGSFEIFIYILSALEIQAIVHEFVHKIKDKAIVY